MSFLKQYVFFILFLKAVFILLTVLHSVGVSDEYNDQIWFWRGKTEFLFLTSMAILCIVVFNPFLKGATVTVGHEIRILFFVYGIILLVKSDWSQVVGA